MSVRSAITTLGLPRELEKLAWEARARITWGEPVADVERWLVENGAGPRIAEEIIEVCVRERARSIRVKGLRDMLIGIPVVVVSVGLAVAVFAAVKFGAQVAPLSGKAAGLAWAFCFLGVMYGLHLTVRGIERLIMGARTKGADSDVDDL